MDATSTAPANTGKVTVEQAGERLLSQLRRKNRSKSHVETVESHIRVHLAPFFDDRELHEITEDDVEDLMDHLAELGRAPKTTRNIVSTLHSILDLAVRKRWAVENVCRLVERPEVPEDPDIHFLTLAELQQLFDLGPSCEDASLTDAERAWRRL